MWRTMLSEWRNWIIVLFVVQLFWQLSTLENQQDCEVPVSIIPRENDKIVSTQPSRIAEALWSPIPILDEYVRTYPQQGAKYLVYQRKHPFGGGLGDSIFGMAHGLILALLTNRTYVINYDKPAPVDAIIEPNLFDWRYSRFRAELEAVDAKDVAHVDNLDKRTNFSEMDIEKDWFQNKKVAYCIGLNVEFMETIWKNPRYKFTALRHFGWYSPFEKVMTSKGAHDPLTAQMLRALFKPSKQLQKQITHFEEVRAGTLRVAVQVRTGSIANGKDPERVKDKELDWFWTCLEDVISTQRHANISLFITSDNATQYELAERKSKELSVMLINTNGTRGIHTDKRQGVTMESWLSNGLEFHLLGNSDILLCSRSSFCEAAAHLYGKRHLSPNLYCGNMGRVHWQ